MKKRILILEDGTVFKGMLLVAKKHQSVKLYSQQE